MSKRLVVFAILAVLATGSPASAARRALVIGNQSYRLGPLANPRNDAQAIAEKLRSMGFDVMSRLDTSLAELQEAVEAYVGRLDPSDVSFVYYAGHGVQLDNTNYLIPVSFSAQEEKDVQYDAYPLDKLLDRLNDRGLKLSVVVLDACRDNPFHKSRGGSRGLVAVNDAKGTLLAFATAPGRVALDDGPGNHGLYTASLLKELDRPNVDVEELFRQVREDVYESSRHTQVPWTSSSVVGGRICLVGDCRADQSLTPPSAPEVAAPPAAIRLDVVPESADFGEHIQNDLSAGNAYLIVESRPPHATVKINSRTAEAQTSLPGVDAQQGRTPTIVKSAGQYIVTIELAQHHAEQRTIRLEAGQKQRLSVDLKPAFGRLVIRNVGADAVELQLDDRSIGTVAASAEYVVERVDSGERTLLVSASRYRASRQTIHVRDREEASVRVALTPAFGTLRVALTPADELSFELDGQPLKPDAIGGSSATFLRVPSGPHILTVARERYEPCTRSISITDGSDVAAECFLVPRFATLRVETEPPGAQVLVDGTPSAGRSPLTLKLDAGDHSLQAVMRPYVGSPVRHRVRAGINEELRLPLEAAFGRVEFKTDPPGAEVFEKDAGEERLGVTPFALDGIPLGRHTYVVRLLGFFQPPEAHIFVERLKTSSLVPEADGVLKLTQKLANLEVVARLRVPDGGGSKVEDYDEACEVSVDGQDWGKAPTNRNVGAEVPHQILTTDLKTGATEKRTLTLAHGEKRTLEVLFDSAELTRAQAERQRALQVQAAASDARAAEMVRHIGEGLQIAGKFLLPTQVYVDFVLGLGWNSKLPIGLQGGLAVQALSFRLMADATIPGIIPALGAAWQPRIGFVRPYLGYRHAWIGASTDFPATESHQLALGAQFDVRKDMFLGLDADIPVTGSILEIRANLGLHLGWIP